MNYKFRKKPIIIEAFQMTKERRWSNEDWPDWLNMAWQKRPGENAMWANPDFPNDPDNYSPAELVCGTLEGVHKIDWDDWIIQGVKGEIYPCKPDIFDLTYYRTT